MVNLENVDHVLGHAFEPDATDEQIGNAHSLAAGYMRGMFSTSIDVWRCNNELVSGVGPIVDYDEAHCEVCGFDLEVCGGMRFYLVPNLGSGDENPVVPPV